MILAINILATIMIVISVLMTLVILVQEDKSGGGMGILGGSSQSFFGASSANLLTRITTVLLVIFFVLSIVIGSLSAKTTKDALISDRLISELEFERGETSTAAAPAVVREAPKEINSEDFEKFILDKIEDESVKTELLTYYTKDKGGVVYSLTKKAAKEKGERIVEILTDVGYSTEAITTIIE